MTRQLILQRAVALALSAMHEALSLSVTITHNGQNMCAHVFWPLCTELDNSVHYGVRCYNLAHSNLLLHARKLL